MSRCLRDSARGGEQSGLRRLGFLSLCWLAIQTALSGQDQPAPPSAEAPAEACLKCHTPIQAALEKKYRHDAVDMGCSSCHADHRQVGEKVEKTPHYLNSKQPDLCLTCHEAGDAKLAEAHRKQPWETSTCTGCHDPHASDAPKLMPPVAHGPFGARKCESCHETAQDGSTLTSLESGAIDQAELHGMLVRLRNLNLTLVSIESFEYETK